MKRSSSVSPTEAVTESGPSSAEGRRFPGLGPKSMEMLAAAGITDLAQLDEIGSVTAFLRVKRAGCKPTLNFLWGLESAITGEDWRQVAKNHRASLLLALEQAETSGE